jgi:hypothetical protein
MFILILFLFYLTIFISTSVLIFGINKKSNKCAHLQELHLQKVNMKDIKQMYTIEANSAHNAKGKNGNILENQMKSLCKILR